MRRLNTILILFLFVALIIVPVNAESYTLTGYQEFNVFDVQKQMFDNVYSISFDKSQQDQAITLIHFKVPQEHTVSFTIYYGVGNSVSGTANNVWNVSLIPAQSTTSTLTFDGQTKQYSYVDTNPEFDYYLSGYARAANVSGLLVYSAGYAGFDNDLAIFKPVANLPVNLIYRVDMSCDVPFDADISYGSKGDVAQSVSKTILEVAAEWVNFGIQTSVFVMEFIVILLHWLMFIWKNIFWFISGYVVLTAAFAARNARGNLSKFYRTWFNDQKALVEFLISLFRALVEIPAAIWSFIKP